MVPTIAVIVVIIGVGVGILAYRYRTEKGIESGITSFRRELHALAPRPGERDGSNDAKLATGDPRGLTIMPPDAAPEPEPHEPDEPEPDEPEPEPEPEPESDEPEADETEPPETASTATTVDPPDERPDT